MRRTLEDVTEMPGGEQRDRVGDDIPDPSALEVPAQRVPEPGQRVPEPAQHVPEPAQHVPGPAQHVPEPLARTPEEGEDATDPSREAATDHPRTSTGHTGLPAVHLSVVAIIAAVAALFGGVVGGVIGANQATQSANMMTAAGGKSFVSPMPNGLAVPQVVSAVSRSVAEVEVNSIGGKDTGSGIILTSDGTILTNNHVVSAASNGEITVRFSDGRAGETASARVLSTDPKNDLALIQAEQVTGLSPARLGDSSTIQVGSPVVAIGSPQGLQGTVTSGIISALNRELRVNDTGPGTLPGTPPARYKAIQTDASLNPGNSGGPLVDMQGRVIGINSAIYARESKGEGIGLGFAIPINQAKRLIHKAGVSTSGR